MNGQAYKVFKKRTKSFMESINVVIYGTIPEIIVDEGGDVTNPKKNNENGNSSQDSCAEKESPENESSPSPSRRETRSSHVPSSPLTPPEFQPPVSCDDDALSIPSASKRPSSRVNLNHPKSNIIRDIEDSA